ncbi:Odorant receptor 67d, partial [Pseudolycoriella hygida]
NDWIPGYPIAFILFEEIMFYCYVGTKKSTANEKLCAIICSTNWYEYDLSSQKLILSQLQSCQNSSELEIGPLAPMNLMTGVQIVKSIYSYYTILTELL